MWSDQMQVPKGKKRRTLIHQKRLQRRPLRAALRQNEQLPTAKEGKHRFHEVKQTRS